MSIAINNPEAEERVENSRPLRLRRGGGGRGGDAALTPTLIPPRMRGGARSVSVQQTRAPRVAFVVNGDTNSAMAQRARAFAGHLSQHQVEICFRSSRKVLSIFAFLWFLIRTRPRATYVFDISYSGVLAAALYKLSIGNALVVDTGDAITELARSMGRGRAGVLLTSLLEQFALRVADRVIVRGSFHRELLARAGIRAEVIQDGVDVNSFAAEDVRELRKQNGLSDVLTIGLVGSSVWSERLQMCYGWELVEAMRLLKDKPVKGIMIGGGSGIRKLRARCREYGIEDKIFFLDHVPFDELAHHLSLIDVCLSTQTNDVAGNVRTTGKLPLYLAADRFILASKVGEAARVLPNEMLVDYDGIKDETYPAKIAARIESILSDPTTLSARASNTSLARHHFDYPMLAQRVARVIDGAINER